MVMAVKNMYRVVYESRRDDEWVDELDGWWVNVRTAINSISSEFLVTKVLQCIRDEWVEVWKL